MYLSYVCYYLLEHTISCPHEEHNVASMTKRMSCHMEEKRKTSRGLQTVLLMEIPEPIVDDIIIIQCITEKRKSSRENVRSSRQLKLTLVPENIYQLLLISFSFEKAIKRIKDRELKLRADEKCEQSFAPYFTYFC